MHARPGHWRWRCCLPLPSFSKFFLEELAVEITVTASDESAATPSPESSTPSGMTVPITAHPQVKVILQDVASAAVHETLQMAIGLDGACAKVALYHSTDPKSWAIDHWQGETFRRPYSSYCIARVPWLVSARSIYFSDMLCPP